MIILGVDFGDARTGLASCDKDEMMAVGAGCVSGGFKKALEGACDAARRVREVPNAVILPQSLRR